MYYEHEMQEKIDNLTELIKSLKSEMNAFSIASSAVASDRGDAKFCFETKDGSRVYTTAVRELYYRLLADQLPPAKVASTIRTVLKSFLPSLDVDTLKLPGETCA